jgi:hypothetical protein
MPIDGYGEGEIGYHAYLLVNAGLADGTDITCTTDPGPSYRLTRLTASGHDFADSARTQFIWDEVMTTMREQGVVSASIDLLKRLLDKALRKRLEGEKS